MTTLARRIAAGFTALAAVGLGTFAAAPAAQAAVNNRYVALGDSYAAGFGLPAPAVPTGKPVPGCAQTTLNYPHLLARALNLTLTDVTCSGATTDDFYAPQATDAGNAPAQLAALKRVHPGIVTVTIGGNDLGFFHIVTDCLAASAHGPLLLHPSYASCAAYYTSTKADGGASDNPFGRLAATQAKVRKALAAVHQAAPQAKIFVIAYPAIEPDAAHVPAGGCFRAEATPGGVFPSAFPFTDVDVTFQQKLQQRLDAAIGAAARAVGAHYADIYPSSLSHSACSPERTRWVEPIEPGGGGTNFLHPSIAGAQAMAIALVRKVIYPVT